jgi:hypothetical protein
MPWEFMGEIEQGGLLLLSDDEMAYDDVEEVELLSELLSEETSDRPWGSWFKNTSVIV